MRFLFNSVFAVALLASAFAAVTGSQQDISTQLIASADLTGTPDHG
ncbi:hypothetical protein [Paludifilum halophilum]|nr:hypothetical protein [Paludifilum halophilum]